MHNITEHNRNLHTRQFSRLSDNFFLIFLSASDNFTWPAYNNNHLHFNSRKNLSDTFNVGGVSLSLFFQINSYDPSKGYFIHLFFRWWRNRWIGMSVFYLKMSCCWVTTLCYNEILKFILIWFKWCSHKINNVMSYL